MEGRRQELAEGDAGDDAQKDPDGQIALEGRHRRASYLLRGGFALRTHT